MRIQATSTTQQLTNLGGDVILPNEEPLLAFGQWVIEIRDTVIVHWDNILNGQMQDAEPNKMDNILNTLGNKEQQIVLALVPKIVDTALHYLLAEMEHTPNLDVAVRTGVGNVSSIMEVSDGLAGELYGENGWIARYSKQRIGIGPVRLP